MTEVRPDSPAAQAGLAAGDVICEVNRTRVERLSDVDRGMARTSGSAGQVLLLAPGVECGPAGDRHDLRLTRQRNIPAGHPHPPWHRMGGWSILVGR